LDVKLHERPNWEMLTLGYPNQGNLYIRKLCELKYLSSKRKRNQPRFYK